MSIEVLPTADSRAGEQQLSSVDDLLADEEQHELTVDLHEMARRRREAESSSGALRIS